MSQIPILLRGGVHAKTPIKQYSKKVKKNNKKGSMNVKEKNDVQTTAALLRVCEQRKTSKGTN